MWHLKCIMLAPCLNFTIAHYLRVWSGCRSQYTISPLPFRFHSGSRAARYRDSLILRPCLPGWNSRFLILSIFDGYLTRIWCTVNGDVCLAVLFRVWISRLDSDWEGPDFPSIHSREKGVSGKICLLMTREESTWGLSQYILHPSHPVPKFLFPACSPSVIGCISIKRNCVHWDVSPETRKNMCLTGVAS